MDLTQIESVDFFPLPLLAPSFYSVASFFHFNIFYEMYELGVLSLTFFHSRSQFHLFHIARA